MVRRNNGETRTVSPRGACSAGIESFTPYVRSPHAAPLRPQVLRNVVETMGREYQCTSSAV